MSDAVTRRLQREVAALPRTCDDVAQAFRGAVALITPHLPFDGWCGLTLDPATLLMTGGVHERGLPARHARRLLELEHSGEEDVNLLADLARRTPPVGWLSEATSGQLESSRRYREVLRPSGIAHELRAVACAGARAWGALVLLRAQSSADFVAADKRLLADLAHPLADALRGVLLKGAAQQPAALTDRAMVVLDAGNHASIATPAARQRLAELAEHGPQDSEGIPHTVLMLANKARRDGSGTRQLRARGRNGQWLTVHATCTDIAGQVVVLIEPSRPVEVASLILEAYGLTAREGELVHCVLHGFDTEQIAELMAISPYTVQDHLKKVFDKVGVWSRKELVSRLFFKHYLPRLEQGLALGPDGWFLERR